MRQSAFELAKPIVFCVCVYGIFAVGSLAAEDTQTAQDPEFSMAEVWIAMPDGVRLAADLYMPVGGAARRDVSRCCSSTPYRKDESRAGRLFPCIPTSSKRGYIVARVDIRGTGRQRRPARAVRILRPGTGGRRSRHRLAVEAARGRTARSACSASRGAASMRSRWRCAIRPRCKAIIAVDATEDLYQDDVHLHGRHHARRFLGDEPGPLQRAAGGARLRASTTPTSATASTPQPWMLTYKKQQRDGPFWDRASARTGTQRFAFPHFHIGGWYDGYRDSLPRMLENVQAPVKAMIGAWSHAWPHEPYPKPGMEWRHEAVRWFDHWLKGKRHRDHGRSRVLRCMCATGIRPGPYLEFAPGRWRYEDGWPLARIEQRSCSIRRPITRLCAAQGRGHTSPATLRAAIGVEAGGPVMWWGDVAHDQRPTDAFSLVYDCDAARRGTRNPRPAACAAAGRRPMRRRPTGSCACRTWRRTAR